jgi:hypothetical protein
LLGLLHGTPAEGLALFTIYDRPEKEKENYDLQFKTRSLSTGSIRQHSDVLIDASS